MCGSISVSDEIIHKSVYKAINEYISEKNDAMQILLSELGKQLGGDDYADDLYNIENSIRELDKKMEEAAILEATTEGNKERIREEIIGLSQQIVALRNEKSIIEEKIVSSQTRNEDLRDFSKELSLYNSDFAEIADNKLRRIIEEVRIKTDRSIVIILKNGESIEESLFGK